ncbi:MAG: 2-amino-4-hydroxy-6-hydroxymethyldihydropteridine diphosphokinase [Ardenticatenaceae bacterium]|nr:2-amino-4-hydroxy-6-hydroxymethyldihydropteridine diphosphokinase [Anaerolineales bacterium]MCB8921752.1 2-amino-4-hydroxy-6-hydroxymethyldihydropteridine diphosphokinase [Ardenticatenaceae bacterium]MCB8990729.1 2-amino-4-hydroxy-6-hydroxymethyldihydropteridine diphosphokinase [Ardenticatenaceae bacterium]
MNQIYLGLGTNLGQREQNVKNALTGLAHFCTVTAVSPLYETLAWGVTSQPSFLNFCAAAQTNLAPHTLLTQLKQLEKTMGRTPTYRWGPRLIDIDILFYNDLILNDDRLTIPHPQLAERAFVLVPLAHIAASVRHPQTGKSVEEMVTAVDQSSVNYYAPAPWPLEN